MLLGCFIFLMLCCDRETKKLISEKYAKRLWGSSGQQLGIVNELQTK